MAKSSCSLLLLSEVKMHEQVFGIEIETGNCVSNLFHPFVFESRQLSAVFEQDLFNLLKYLKTKCLSVPAWLIVFG